MKKDNLALKYKIKGAAPGFKPLSALEADGDEGHNGKPASEDLAYHILSADGQTTLAV